MEDIFLSRLEALVIHLFGFQAPLHIQAPDSYVLGIALLIVLFHLGRDTKIPRGPAFKARSTKDIKVMPKRTISHCCRSWMLGEEVTIQPRLEASRNQFSAPLPRMPPQHHA
jgi:hypothetical protein